MIHEEMARLETVGRWNDRRLKYPFPDMSEPEKVVCYLTYRGDYDASHLAQLYLKASLHAVDSYFTTRCAPASHHCSVPTTRRATPGAPGTAISPTTRAWCRSSWICCEPTTTTA